MAAPVPADAPVIEPVMVPKDHEKVLAADAVKLRPVEVKLQILFVVAFVTTGRGLTVTVNVNGDPTQEPAVEVAVIMYGTVPATALPGLVRV